jgi:F0F1-type ATP synthase membrane subunit b/b'
VAAARRAAERTVADAKSQLAEQAEQAKRSLAADTQALADQITQAILGGKAA